MRSPSVVTSCAVASCNAASFTAASLTAALLTAARSTVAQAILLLLATLACPAHAALGGAPTDLSNGGVLRARQLGAVNAATSTNGTASAPYTVNETTLDSGTVVREYIGAGGAVFAISWSGPFMPDLRTLLAEHFGALTAAAAAQRGRGQVRVDRSDLVIESGGHMRAWSGRAWLPAALPAGWNSEALQ